MKNIKVIIIAVALVTAAGGIVYSCGKKAEPPEVEKVAKRVKVELPEEEKKAAPEAPSVGQEVAPENKKEAEKPPVKEEAKALTKPGEAKIEGKSPEAMPVPKKEEVAKVVEKRPEVKERPKPKDMPAPEKKAEKKEVEEVASRQKTEPKKEASKGEVKGVSKGSFMAQGANKFSSAPSWALHIASYVTREEAASMEKRLKEDGYNAYITDFNLKGKRWYRLRVGFYPTEEAAKAIGKKIAKAYGIADVWVVKPVRKEILSH